MRDHDPEQFQYQPMRPHERMLGFTVAQNIRSDEEIMETIDGFHAEDLRCAVVVILTPDGKFKNGYTAEESAVHEYFPFPPIREAVSSYDVADTFCVVVARGRDVTALVAPRDLTLE